MRSVDFSVDSASKQLLYTQLYAKVAESIRNGTLPAECKLPSVRVMAKEQNISRNTVTKAYSELEKDGFIYSRLKSGYYVSGSAPRAPARGGAAAREEGASAGVLTVEEIMRQHRERVQAMQAGAAHGRVRRPKSAPAETRTGGSDMEEPAEMPAQALEAHLLESCRHVLSALPRAAREKSPAFGDEAFRAAIAAMLKKFHGITAAPGQIVVGAGLDLLLRNILRLKCLTQPYVKNSGVGLLKLATRFTDGTMATVKPVVAAAEGLDAATRTIFTNAHFPIREIPVDDQGVSFDFLVTSGPTLVYVTPYDLPMGALEDNTERRRDILEWTRDVSYRHVIECDSCDEGEILPSYKSGDTGDKVIYLNSFSTLLCKGLTASFAVLPADMVADYQLLYKDFDCQLSRLEQLVLTDFISRGYLDAHLAPCQGLE